MKGKIKTLLLTTALCTGTCTYGQSTEQLLLSGWKFAKGTHTGAEATTFDDTKWQQVTIPHDWAISGPFDKEMDEAVASKNRQLFKGNKS